MSVKLHLGCGKRFLDGYVHIEQDNLPHVDYCTSVGNLSMFAAESVDEIYSCGVFGYFDRAEALGVLKEWRRVLKDSGTLRISMADFSKVVEVYLTNGKNLEGIGILGPTFGRWEITDSDGITRSIYKKTGYDFKSLKRFLEANGFKGVKRYDWRDFLPSGYDDYSKAYVPHMDESGLLLSLNVVAKK